MATLYFWAKLETFDTCEGTSQQLSWGEALRGAKMSDYAQYSDWHVPNIKELASI